MMPLVSSPPLIDPVTGSIVAAIGAATVAGVFTWIVKARRTPADILAQQIAADEAAARRIEADREDRRLREQGFAEAAAFIKASAESAIATYKDQQQELNTTIGVLTNALETTQRLNATQRALSDAEREANESTIVRLRERIVSLQEQVKKLLDLTRAQQVKIAVLEGTNRADDIDNLFPTMTRDEIQSLQSHSPFPQEDSAA